MTPYEPVTAPDRHHNTSLRELYTFFFCSCSAWARMGSSCSRSFGCELVADVFRLKERQTAGTVRRCVSHGKLRCIFLTSNCLDVRVRLVLLIPQVSRTIRIAFQLVPIDGGLYEPQPACWYDGLCVCKPC